MKKDYRLHYVYVDGYEPINPTRNYVCFTIIEPNKQDLKTLAIDEDVLEKIMHHCKDDAHRQYIAGEIQTRIERKIEAGHYEGAISIAV